MAIDLILNSFGKVLLKIVLFIIVLFPLFSFSQSEKRKKIIILPQENSSLLLSPKRICLSTIKWRTYHLKKIKARI